MFRSSVAAVLVAVVGLTLATGIVRAQNPTNGDDLIFRAIAGESFVIHRYTTTGIASTFTPPDGVIGVEYLIVGGGGGGGNLQNNSGTGAGAGGAGGLLKYVAGEASNSGAGPITVTVQAYSIVVGAGGGGGASQLADGSNGSNSTAFGLTALGGGGGGANNNPNRQGQPGGSGGGGGCLSGGTNTGGAGLQPGSASGGFGNQGGNGANVGNAGGGGGGGAGSAGQAGSTSKSGDGGIGIVSSINGTADGYAGGGGGGATTTGSVPAGLGNDGGGDGASTGSGSSGGDGQANTGGGGGGGAANAGTASPGGNGGSGVVAVRYRLSDVTGWITDDYYALPSLGRARNVLVDDSVALQVNANDAFSILPGGTFSVGNGASLAVQGTLTMQGTLNIDAGGQAAIGTDGLLMLDRNGAPALTGNLLISGGSVRFNRSNQIADTANVTITGGHLNSTAGDHHGRRNDHTQTLANLTVTGGTFQTGGGGQWTLTGGATFTGASGNTMASINSGGEFTVETLTLTDLTSTSTTSGDRFVVHGNRPNLTKVVVGAGGLNLNNSRILINWTDSDRAGSALILGGDVTATGTSTIQNMDLPGLVWLNTASDPVARTFNVASGASLQIWASIIDGETNGGSPAGAGSMIKTGAGTLRLSGANTYTGETIVNAGTLMLDRIGGPAVPGDLIISGGNVTFNRDEQIAQAAHVTMTAGNLNSVDRRDNHTETFASLTVTGGMFRPGVGSTWSIGAGAFTGGAGNNLNIAANSGSELAFGNLTLNDMTATDISSGDRFIIYGDNTSAVTRVSVGPDGLLLDNSRVLMSLGTSASFLGATFILEGDVTAAGTSTIQRVGSLAADKMFVWLNTTADPVTRTFSVADDSSLRIEADIIDGRTNGASPAGAAGIVKTGLGTLTLSGANAYTGGTTVSEGTLMLDRNGGPAVPGDLLISGGTVAFNRDNQIANTANVTMTAGQFNAGSGIQRNNHTEMLDSFTATGGIFRSGEGGSSWTISGAGQFTGGTESDLNIAFNSASQVGFASLTLTDVTSTDVNSDSSFTIYGGSSTLTTLSVGADGLTLNNSRILMRRGNSSGHVGNALILDGDVTATGTSTIQIVSGFTIGTSTLHLSSETGEFPRTFHVPGSGSSLRIEAGITNGAADKAGILKTGAGTLTLAGANAYTGDTMVSAGTLRLDTSSGRAVPGDLIVTAGTVTFARHNQIADSAHVTMTAGRFTQRNNHRETIGSLTATGGEFRTGEDSRWTIGGDVALTGGAGNTVFVVNSGSELAMNGLALTDLTSTEFASNNSFTVYGNRSDVTAISVGPGGLTLNNSRILMRTTSGSAGAAVALGGDVTATGTSAFEKAGDLDGYLWLNTTDTPVARTFDVADGGSLRVESIVANGFTDEVDEHDKPVPAAAGRLVKKGPGTLTLTEANTYTGTTTVEAGLLSVTGSLENIGPDAIFVHSADTTFGLNDPRIGLAVPDGSDYSLGSTIVDGHFDFDTFAELIGGSAVGDRTVTMAWRGPGDGETIQTGGPLISDVLSLDGTGDDTYVLQMSYDPTWGGSAHLAWLDDNDAWVNAVAGNTGGTPMFFDAAYDHSLHFNLGSYGVDTAAHVAWAVLNHNSEFGVVPEPGTWLMLLAAGAAGLLLRRRGRR